MNNKFDNIYSIKETIVEGMSNIFSYRSDDEGKI